MSRALEPHHELCRVIGRGRVLGRILGPPPAQAPPRPATALPVTRGSRTPRRRRPRWSSAAGLARTDKTAVFHDNVNVGLLGRIMLDQYEVAATQHNLTIVNNAQRAQLRRFEGAIRYFYSPEGPAGVDRVSQVQHDLH